MPSPFNARMTAGTIESGPVTPSQAQGSQPQVLPTDEQRGEIAPARLAEDRRVERVILRDTIVGAVIGAFVCAPIYVGMVFLALRNSGTALAPNLGMAVGLGMYAGLFLGGCAGMLAGAKTLEHHEHKYLPALPVQQS